MRSRLAGLSGFLHNSFIDFPGTVSAVLFFRGCNLRCPYCHNPGMILDAADIADKSDEVWNYLEKRRGLIDGVVITGGEPSLHPNIVSTVVPELRKMGYKLKLDSNGLNPEFIEEFKPDYFAMDFKTSPERYCSVLKAQMNNVKERLERSIVIVRSMKQNAEIRITVAPGIFDLEDAAIAAEMLKGVEKVFVQPANLHKDILDPAFFVGVKDDEEIILSRQVREIIAPNVGTCIVRGDGAEDRNFVGLG